MSDLNGTPPAGTDTSADLPDAPPPEYSLTRKDIRRSAFRYMFMACNVFNYETQQGGGVVYGLSPTLRKLYPNDTDYGAALENHYRFFNTTTWMANLILGAVLAMEEKDGRKAGPAVQSFKTGLMGPMAGVGDTLVWVLLPTILGSISGYMALEGNPLGGIVWFFLNIFFLFVRFKLFSLGYKSGVHMVTNMGSKLSAFTEAASVMGLTVVGALIASVVTVNVPTVFAMGDVNLDIQSDVLDAIMPALLPASLAMTIYWLLGKKWMTVTRVIMVVLVISLAGAGFGFLAP